MADRSIKRFNSYFSWQLDTFFYHEFFYFLWILKVDMYNYRFHKYCLDFPDHNTLLYVDTNYSKKE